MNIQELNDSQRLTLLTRVHEHQETLLERSANNYSAMLTVRNSPGEASEYEAGYLLAETLLERSQAFKVKLAASKLQPA